MAKSKRKPAATDSRLFVLALGLLVGFVVAFIFLLSRLPVDGIISQYNGTETQGVEMAKMNFDYYAVLQEQQAGRKPAPQQVVAVEPPTVFMEPPREIQPEGLAPPVVQGNDNTSALQRQVEPLAVEPVLVPVQPDVQSDVQPDVQQAAPQAQAQVKPRQVPVPVPVPLEPRAPAQVELPVQPQVQQQRPVPVQPRVQQPQVIPDAPVRVPVTEILASERGADSFYVEAGSYAGNNEALRAQSTLRSIGLEAFIVVRPDGQGAFDHRVRIGPFIDQARLDATRERLRDSGIPAKLIRVKG